jgi:hypothetical protein
MAVTSRDAALLVEVMAVVVSYVGCDAMSATRMVNRRWLAACSEMVEALLEQQVQADGSWTLQDRDWRATSRIIIHLPWISEELFHRIHRISLCSSLVMNEKLTVALSRGFKGKSVTALTAPLCVHMSEKSLVEVCLSFGSTLRTLELCRGR